MLVWVWFWYPLVIQSSWALTCWRAEHSISGAIHFPGAVPHVPSRLKFSSGSKGGQRPFPTSGGVTASFFMITQVDSTMLTANIENGTCPPPWRLSRGVRKDELMERLGKAAELPVHCGTNRGEDRICNWCPHRCKLPVPFLPPAPS